VSFYKNEDDLDNVKHVIWRKEFYEVGNRRHDLVELYRNGVFIRVVKISSLKPVKNKKKEIN